MPNVRGVVNHLKYVRSNWTVVVGGFVLVLASILVGSSLIRSSSDANAATYTYPSSASSYDSGAYTPNNAYQYSNNNGGYTNSNTYVPTNTPQPSYACNTLSIGTTNQRTFRFTTSASASNGASIVGYRYEYGDGGVQNGSSTVDHSYNRAGTFTARAWVLFRVNGQDRWITSTGCTKTVTVANQTPCPYGGNGYTCSPYPTPTPTYTPQPSFTCNNLAVTKVGDRTFRFTTSASASNGASIVGYRYEYGDGGVQNGSSIVDHTYNSAATYTARAWVLFRINGQDRWITSTGCTKTVSVTSYPTPTYSPSPTPTYSPQPSYACNNLSITKIDDRTFRFTTSASASNGASVTGYRYEYGDGGVQDGPATVDHSYNRAATYTARAWVSLSVNGQEKWVTSTGCTKAVYVTGTTPTYSPYPTPTYSPQPSYTPCPASGYNYHCYPSNSQSPSNSVNDNSNTNNNNSAATATATANVVINQAAPAEAKTSTVQNASTVTAPATATNPSTVAPATVTSLPETGPENLVVGGLGFGSMVIAGSTYLNSRRELLGAFLKK